MSYNSLPWSPNSTPLSTEGQVHVVKIGESGVLAFDSLHIQAQPRDVVVF